MEVSPTLISNVTEAVIDEVRQWQTRPLEPVYPIVYVDCLVINVRENQRVINKALYLIMKGPTLIAMILSLVTQLSLVPRGTISVIRAEWSLNLSRRGVCR